MITASMKIILTLHLPLRSAAASTVDVCGAWGKDGVGAADDSGIGDSGGSEMNKKEFSFITPINILTIELF